MTCAMSPESVVTALRSARLPLEREKETQAVIAATFDAAGIGYRREVDIGKRDIIDFLVNGIGIEVKIGGAKRAILKQCTRYCETGKLSALILATNVAIGFPREVAGVPCFVVSLGRAWL